MFCEQKIKRITKSRIKVTIDDSYICLFDSEGNYKKRNNGIFLGEEIIYCMYEKLINMPSTLLSTILKVLLNLEAVP